MAENSVLAQCSLSEEIDRFTPRDDDESGRRAEILVKEDDLRITLVTVRGGTELAEHSAPSSISIQVLKGRMELHYEGQTATLETGDLISLKKDVRHSVKALEDGAFLLTLGWTTG